MVLKEVQLTPEVWGRIYKGDSVWVLLVIASASVHPLDVRDFQTEDAAIDYLQKLMLRWKSVSENKNEA
jgi:hypothetical protein